MKRRLHGIYPRDVVPPRSTYYDSGKFGRMFRNLPPFALDTPNLRKNLLGIGAAGGVMDAKDDRNATAEALVLDPALSQNNPNSTNPGMTAGMTFLGQFIDHDITLDLNSTLERKADPEKIANFRVPTLALDNLYGLGPGAVHISTIARSTLA